MGKEYHSPEFHIVELQEQDECMSCSMRAVRVATVQTEEWGQSSEYRTHIWSGSDSDEE